MEKITEIFDKRQKTFSFELFPPKTEEGYKKLLETIRLLVELKPDFVSCTYGAGGGNRDKTLDIVEHVEKSHQIPSIAHLTCVLNTRDDIKNILDNIKARDIKNVLALYGDQPKDNPNWKPEKENFKYAYELCDFIKQNYDNYFSIGVAGFPEGHILCSDKNLDAQYLKTKINSGADYVITQLFFDNNDYYEYVKRLKSLGINARVIPGILPITDYYGVLKFCKTCGTTIPKKVQKLFSPIADDKPAILQQGIDFCIEQCRDLLKNGAPGIHFYPLNKISPINEIFKEVKTLS